MKLFALKVNVKKILAMTLALAFPLNLAWAGTPNPENETCATEPGKVPIELFVRPDCKHCEDEKNFFLQLRLARDDFSVHFHDISQPEHYRLWQQLTTLEHLPKVTPITLVANRVIQGFDSPQTTGSRIQQLIDQAQASKVETVNFQEFIAQGGSGKVEAAGATCSAQESEAAFCTVESEEQLLVTVPFLGVRDLKKYSLPTLSVILGFIDGFNPCAMWVLITFLVVLAQAGSRKRMWQIAGIFIFAEAIMYFFILNVWFTLWDFVGLDKIITPIVGTIAIGGGIFFLWEWKNSDGTCQVTSIEQRAKTSQKINKLVNAEMTILTVLGIIGLALSVNVIEFACSIGIPQAFTKIVEMSHLSLFQQQLHMGIYVLFYMLDDFFIFSIALYSFEKIGLTTKYSRMSHLVGGILMMMLGLILIFKRDLLIF